ncbi:uncharacterized protein YcbX [Allocatelliglobosispora scoriae]|uniref:Uncharacterized protein YcbX n=1 Tax=Allocatelliglobosispora scoriae TaxID=643052 RepID=A0A841BTN3_9ACTN|nr:MOSC N-terminal beta barrel domain-containing protein [Allocatelliglobosispora scoriae]MBB5870141.1 uncharacterized protein YcbX [Allocatelliglobosispora scoriae]
MFVSSLHTYPVKGCYRLDHDVVAVEPWGFAGDRRWLITDPDHHFVSQREEARLALVRPSLTMDGLVLDAPGMESIEVPHPIGGELAAVTVWKSTFDAALADKSASGWLSDFLGRDLRLFWLDDPTRRASNPAFSEPGDRVSFADGYPVLLASVSSLAQLNDWIAQDFPDDAALLGPLPMTRFRPNVVISGGPAWAEDGFTGRRVRIGGTTFRVPKPCGRCVVTTIDQESAERTRQPLRTLAKYRHLNSDLVFATNLIPDDPQAAAVISLGDPVVLA